MPFKLLISSDAPRTSSGRIPAEKVTAGKPEAAVSYSSTREAVLKAEICCGAVKNRITAQRGNKPAHDIVHAVDGDRRLLRPIVRGKLRGHDVHPVERPPSLILFQARGVVCPAKQRLKKRTATNFQHCILKLWPALFMFVRFCRLAVLLRDNKNLCEVPPCSQRQTTSKVQHNEHLRPEISFLSLSTTLFLTFTSCLMHFFQ